MGLDWDDRVSLAGWCLLAMLAAPPAIQHAGKKQYREEEGVDGVDGRGRGRPRTVKEGRKEGCLLSLFCRSSIEKLLSDRQAGSAGRQAGGIRKKEGLS